MAFLTGLQLGASQPMLLKQSLILPQFIGVDLLRHRCIQDLPDGPIFWFTAEFGGGISENQIQPSELAIGVIHATSFSDALAVPFCCGAGHHKLRRV